MLILSVPIGIIASLFLLAPGIVWAWMCWPAESRAEQFAVGIGIGLAFQMHLAALLSAGPGITTVSVLVITCVGWLLAGSLAWRLRVPLQQRTNSRQQLSLVVVLALCTVIPLLPLAVHQVPQGWDPSFHSLLASTTVDGGRLPAWMPYEPIPSNYPYGPHVIIAEVSLLSGLEPHQTFAGLLNVLLPAISGLAIYAFARRVLPTAGAALASVAAYGLLGNWGSLDDPRWGGLPNALGCFLLLVFLAVLFGAGFERVRVIVGGILLGAIPLAHHHVMLTTVLLLASYGVVLVVRVVVARDDAARQGPLVALRRLLLMSGIALISVAYYAVPLAIRASEIQDSSVLRYFDHDPGVIFADNGWLLWIFTLAGVGMVILGRAWRRGSTLRTPALGFVVMANATLIMAFFCGYYAYRAYSLSVYHLPYTAFTPTRFLTDMTYFMAPFAGLALDGLWRWTTRLPALARRDGNFGAWPTIIARTGIVLMVIFSGGVTILEQFQPGEGTLVPGEAEAFAWVYAHTPPDTLVVNLDANNRWAPYFTHREAAFTPIPVSEFTVGYVAEKQFLVKLALDLQGETGPSRIIAMASASSASSALRGRPVAIIADETAAEMSAMPVFTSGSERVYFIPGFFDLLQATSARTVQWWSGSREPPAGWQSGGTYPLQGRWVTAPPHAGIAYMRMTLQEPLPARATVACQAEGATLLYVDSRPLPNGCRNGQRVPLPQLVGSGPHTLAARAQLGHNLGPWFDLFVLE